ncbi:MAG: YceH family protein [Acidimicrobiales bacterium]
MDLTAEQARVVGCLIEKAQTTPDSYPLSSNALTNACNQSTNRNPVVDYSERQVDALMLELREMKLARTVTGSGHRVGKHKHVVDEALGLDGHELAVLAALVLRGPQTLNEIATRTERYTDGPHGDKAAVDAAIDRLATRPEPLAVRLPRQSGEREPRVDQCWSASHTSVAPAPPVQGTDPDAVPPPMSAGSVEPAAHRTDLEARVAALESAMAEQTRRIDHLLDELGA